MRKAKCECPPKEIMAPFYLLTFADLVINLLAMFIMLYAMTPRSASSLSSSLGMISGSLGITKGFEFSPMQQNVPAPAIPKSTLKVARSDVKPSKLDPRASYVRDSDTQPVQQDDSEGTKSPTVFGLGADMQMTSSEDEVVLSLPTFEVFSGNSAVIDIKSSKVQEAGRKFQALAKQIAKLVDYNVEFVGHTDSVENASIEAGHRSNMELGFLRAVALYEAFFERDIPDKTRVRFSSMGDNVPIVQNAQYDSQHRKNRRVEVRLKKRKTGESHG